jgi:A/G-specific adenine glycosylase
MLSPSDPGAGRTSTIAPQEVVVSGEELDSAKLKLFRKSLLDWFETYQRDLPWRKNRDPYRIWISEIMLQQTRVRTVIPYYQKFLRRFPDVRTLAAAPQEEVLRLWSGLGYYSRARNLQRAAQQIVSKHGGEFPHEGEDVLALAGIGEYTAAAILSIAFGENHAVLDGNVARVVSRLEAIRGDLREPFRWRKLQSTADQLLARDSAGDWNHAMMELGATLCTPRSPQCLLCPAAQFCKARKLGIAELLPEKRKKRAIVAVELCSIVFVDAKKDSLLLPPPAVLAKSAADDHIPSLVAKLWHFPTLSAPRGAEIAVRTLLHCDLRIKPTKSIQPTPLERVRHTVTYRALSVTPFLIHVKQLPKIPGAKHLPISDVPSMPVSNLTRKIAKSALKTISAPKIKG